VSGSLLQRLPDQRRTMNELKGKLTSDGVDLVVDCPIHGTEQVAIQFSIGYEWSKCACFKCYSEVVVELVERHQLRIQNE